MCFLKVHYVGRTDKQLVAFCYLWRRYGSSSNGWYEAEIHMHEWSSFFFLLINIKGTKAWMWTDNEGFWCGDNDTRLLYTFFLLLLIWQWWIASWPLERSHIKDFKRWKENLHSRDLTGQETQPVGPHSAHKSASLNRDINKTLQFKSQATLQPALQTRKRLSRTEPHATAAARVRQSNKTKRTGCLCLKRASAGQTG